MSSSQVQPSPWVLASEPTSLGDPSGLVTLVDGQTFCLSGRSGDFSTNPTHGVFFADMRVLSQARLLVGGVTVESLAVSLTDASGATFVGRSIPASTTEPRVLVVRRRQLGSVWHEQIELRNTGAIRCDDGCRVGGCRRLRRRLRDQGGPAEQSRRALAGGPRAQPPVRMAPRRRASPGRAERGRATRSRVDPRLRVEGDHRAAWRLPAAARSHRGPRQLVDRTPSPPSQLAQRREPQRRLVGVGAEAAQRRPQPRARRTTGRSRTSAHCACTTLRGAASR